ncbi:SMP-30/gluconolactonase/LRE family protein [Sneathiella sp.]|uniref:SMP-30/gluconolactonase/LRE family protein n=1 Tax=Sneathiella sp. TaxID=1964365 RepID=UPI003562C72A
MSLIRDILDRVFFPNRDVHAISSLDGGFSPNRRLDDAEIIADLPGVNGVCIGENGSVYASSGNQIVCWPNGDFLKSSTFAELDALVGSLATHPDGRVFAAVSGRGIVALNGEGQITGRLEIVGDTPLECVTAIAVLPDGSVAITDGSRHYAVEGWLQDLMEKRIGSGRLVLCNADLLSARVVCDGLSWPAGIATASDALTLLVTEAWTHRLLSIVVDTGAQTVLVKNFAAYPGRITPSSSGGFWIAFFAMRTQLIEFVLREDAFRNRMMRSVAPDLWIGPSLGDHFDYREPTQIGRIKKLGIQKPWAPPRSYGLVARIDAAGTAVESLHSRVSGTTHGIMDIADTGGQLIVASRGNGKLVKIELERGKAS